MKSKWRIVYEPRARGQLRAIDPQQALRIAKTLDRELERHGDPYHFFERLLGAWEGHWRERASAITA